MGKKEQTRDRTEKGGRKKRSNTHAHAHTHAHAQRVMLDAIYKKKNAASYNRKNRVFLGLDAFFFNSFLPQVLVLTQLHLFFHL